MPSELSVKFHGCRGSFPVAGRKFERYGGATSCVVVRAGSRTLIFDAGTGIVNHSHDLIEAYRQDQAPIQAHIFLTHLHLDHIIGLPFFAPMYMPDATVDVWSPLMGHFKSVQESIEAFITTPFFPVPLHEMESLKRFHEVGEHFVVYFLKDEAEPIKLRHRHPSDQARIPAPDKIEVEVHCLRGFNHPKNGVLLYKVVYQGRSIVYATDTEGYVHGDQRLVRFAQGADILIHDAMYTDDRYISMPMPTQGFGHSTIEIAARVATQCQAKSLYLFHHDPTCDDDALDAAQALGQTFFPNSVAARDGLVVEIAL